jgi:hypothetical protein
MQKDRSRVFSGFLELFSNGKRPWTGFTVLWTESTPLAHGVAIPDQFTGVH